MNKFFLRAAFAALSLSLVSLPAYAQHDQGHADHAAITLGDIEISGAFSRATLPNAPVAGGFVTLTNNGSEDDRLVSVTAPITDNAQIHEMAMEGDVMKMRQLVDGLVIPAGGSVTLEPGGYHLMFMGITQPVVEGDTLPVTMVFEKAGEITVDFAVGAAAATGAGGHDGHEGH